MEISIEKKKHQNHRESSRSRIPRDGKVEEEVKHQINKTNRAAGCLKDILYGRANTYQ
jgi:hypothetical protein